MRLSFLAFWELGMSGKEAVRSLRERGLQPARPDFGPTLRMVGLVLVAFIVGGGAVYGGAKFLAGPPRPAQAAVPAVAMVTEIPAFTNTDMAVCDKAYDRHFQSERDAHEQAMLEGQIVASGGSGAVGPMGARLRCLAATKPERFCDPEQRAVFVAAVKEYIEQAIFISAISEATDFSMNVYMPMVATATDTEKYMPDTSIITDMTKGVNERMADAHKKVAASLRKLVEEGYLREEHFGTFMGFGVPMIVTKMLKGAVPGPSVCA
jgi:hypothetical protein